MSHNDSAATGATCDKCGRTFGNAGAAGRHAKACDGDGAKSPEGDAIRPADVEVRDLAHVCEHMREADFRKSLDVIGFTPADGDTLATAFAKAHIRAKGGEKSAYVEAFGRCSADGCEYGANGFERDACKRHEGEREAEPEPEPQEGDPFTEPERQGDADAMPAESATPEGEGVDATREATLAAEMLKSGVSEAEAVDAARYALTLVGEGVDADVAGRMAAKRFR